MRRSLWVLVAVSAVSAWANPGRAQVPAASGFSDPFFLYYGWYLPRQAALADQPRIQDTISANVAAQQVYAQTNRSSLYDPNGGYGRFDPNSTYDPFNPASQGGPRPRSGTPMPKMRSGTPTSNINGQGPAIHYNRTAQYYPSIRQGQGPNRNVSMAGRGVRRGASFGAMGMPSPMPGPR
jgi:hypothetical protein